MSTTTTNVWQKLLKRAAGLPFWNIVVVVSYIFFIFFCMGPTIWKCNDTLSGLGDSTGGPVWRAGLDPAQPLLGGYEHVTNYPTGENLYSPVGFVSIEQTLMMSAASKVVGPVCAYNVINMVGYLSTAVVMFAFILYLLKSRWIAWLAGFEVSFTPYAQSKVGGHPSYGYASLLIAVFWLTLHVIKRKKWVHGVGLGAILAVCAYFDPYFILLSGTVLVPVVGVWGIVALTNYRKGKKERQAIQGSFKTFLVAFVSLFVLIMPLAIVRIKDRAIINSSTGAVRGNIEAAAMKCSNFPQDYLLPDPYNTYLVKLLGSAYTAKNIESRHWCGNGESRVAISLTLITVTVLGLTALLWERLNSRKLRLGEILHYEPAIVVGSLLAVALAAFLLGLPPRIGRFTMPSGVIIMLTKTWRIFGREYLVLNMAVVILFSIMLRYFYETFKHKSKTILKVIFVILSLAIMLEYQIHDPFIPFTFSYSRDVPQIYRQIKDDPAITAIAEYPLDRSGIEADSIVYYLTMQTVHRKPILNSAAISDVNENLHISIKDLTDPQTFPVLRKLGIKYITVHGLTADQVLAKTDQLRIIREETPPVYGLTMIHAAPTNTFVLAQIVDGPTTDYAVTMQKGFVVNNPIMKSSIDMEYETIPDSELAITPLPNTKLTQPAMACFDIKMAGAQDTSEIEISVNGKVQQKILATDTYTKVQVEAQPGDTILIHNLKMHNTRLNNLGCAR